MVPYMYVAVVKFADYLYYARVCLILLHVHIHVCVHGLWHVHISTCVMNALRHDIICVTMVLSMRFLGWRECVCVCVCATGISFP